MCCRRKDDVSDTPFIRIHKTAGVYFYLKKQPARKVHRFSPIAETHESGLMFQNVLFESTENIVFLSEDVC